MEETPKRPLAHATLSGSFVLISTIGIISLAVSVIGTALGWFDAATNTTQPDETSAVSIKPMSTDGGWRSLKRAAQGISRTQVTTKATKYPSLSESMEVPNVSDSVPVPSRPKRAFGEQFKSSLRAFIGGAKLDSFQLATAYMTYESHYSDASAVLAASRVERAQQWLDQAKAPSQHESVEAWLTALQSTLIGSDAIHYNKYSNLVINIPESNRLQCQSASVALALAAMRQTLPAGWRPVFVTTPGHVKFGLVRDAEIFVVESTRTTSGVLRTPLRSLKGQKVTDARLSLLGTMAVDVDLSDEWRTSDWAKRVELFGVAAVHRGPKDTFTRTHDGPPLLGAEGAGPPIPEGTLKRSAGAAPEAVWTPRTGLAVVPAQSPQSEDSPGVGQTGSERFLGLRFHVVGNRFRNAKRFRGTRKPARVAQNMPDNVAELTAQVTDDGQDDTPLITMKTTIGPVLGNQGAGVIEPKSIIDVVEVQHAGLWRCFFDVPLMDDSHWRFNLRLSVQPDGHVSKVMFIKDSLQQIAAARCIRRLFKKTVFPKPRGGQAVIEMPLFLRIPRSGD